MNDPRVLTENDLVPLLERLTTVEGRLDAHDVLLAAIMSKNQLKQLELDMTLTRQVTGMDGRKIAGKLHRMLNSSKIYVHELAERATICLAEIRAAHNSAK